MRLRRWGVPYKIIVSSGFGRIHLGLDVRGKVNATGSRQRQPGCHQQRHVQRQTRFVFHAFRAPIVLAPIIRTGRAAGNWLAKKKRPARGGAFVVRLS